MIPTRSKIAAVAATGAVLLGTALAAAPALAAESSTTQAMWLYDITSSEPTAPIPNGTTLKWTTAVIGSPSSKIADIETAKFTGSSDATAVKIFLAPRGKEDSIADWAASGDGGFNFSSKDVLQPNLTLDGLIYGNPLGVKATGGDYSLGVAWTKNNNLTLASAPLVFNKITVKPGGDWTFQDIKDPVTTPPNPPADPKLTGQVGLKAITTAQNDDGGLSLNVPTGAMATIGDPKLVGGLSTSTGKLGQITVSDKRYATQPGWNLTSSVADFTGNGKTIASKQLGVKPLVVSGPGVAAAGNTAGTASDGKFASADKGASGDTVLDADLTFVAPSGTPAGTYTSTMTLTLTSK